MSSHPTSLRVMALMAASVVVTIVLAVVISVELGSQRAPFNTRSGAVEAGAVARPIAVYATITAGDVVVQRTLPAASFALEPGQSLDPRIPPGPFTADIEVTFEPGIVSYAYLGARLHGASLIIFDGDDPVFSTHAAVDEVKLTPAPVAVGGARRRTIVHRVEGGGDAAIRWRAMWQPEDSATALPLPVIEGPLLGEAHVRGLALAQTLGCSSCHQPEDETLAAQLALAPGPVLGDIGARAHPSWLRRWLTDPYAVSAHAAMPKLLGDDDVSRDFVEDLVHFMVSMGGPIDLARTQPDPATAETGMTLYHSVGCAACHGPLEAVEDLPGGRPAGPKPWGSYHDLDVLAGKTTGAALASFLRDPASVHTSGRMPSQSLDGAEAAAIAAYLMQRVVGDDVEPAFEIEDDRVARGRAAFGALGCANCHELGPNRTAIVARRTAAPLDALAARASEGCLADAPQLPVPSYTLDTRDREDLRAFVSSLAERVTHDVPIDVLSADLERLGCTMCHGFHGNAGAEPALTRFFEADEHADLGDEGRIPPALDGVGAKLHPSWLRRVLGEHGRARPYMHTRMPDYDGATAARLVDGFIAAAGVGREPAVAPEFDATHAAAGRHLVGGDGFDCIQCHEIAGRDATGTPGPDLALMTERLRWPAFSQWVHDPTRVRPGTRMPPFFFSGRSGFGDILDGEADPQIAAIWSYLSQGEMLPLPDGLVSATINEIIVGLEPTIFRTYMRDAGTRAIACGFPEGVHCAFDAESCRMSIAWAGDFIDASGAWANRGGNQTNPNDVGWRGASEPWVQIGDQAGEPDFRGYQLDADRMPVLRYAFDFADARIEIEERPRPVRTLDSSSIVRNLRLSGPPGTTVRIRDGEAWRDVELSDAGVAETELEIAW